MTASLDSEAKVRPTAQLPVSRQKSVNFEPAGYSLSESFSQNIFFARRRKSLREKNIASVSSTQAGSGTPQVG